LYSTASQSQNYYRYPSTVSCDDPTGLRTRVPVRGPRGCWTSRSIIP